MRISYAITCYNEIEETKRLLKFLVKHSREQDEIVVFWDNNGPEELRNFLEEFYNSNPINFYAITFNKNFSELKNSLKKECNGDYIFQIDADEMLTEEFINQLPDILETNSNVEMFRVPRVNTVEGITQQHIQQWRWNVNENGWVNWPDYQDRILKNKEEIRWERPVHEIITGYKTVSELPADPLFALIHEKTIEKQEKQNQLYNTI